MKVIRPTNNKISGPYTATHKAYDFEGLNVPDEIRAGMDGTVVETSNLYSGSWLANKLGDPFLPAAGKPPRPLLVADYGNYIKVKHDDGTIELHCHLKKDSMLMIGTRVKAGQVIARIGNTGNSTGPHLHSEFRTAQNVNTQVEFITSSPVIPTPTDNITRKASFFDLYWHALFGNQIDTDKVTKLEVEARIKEAKSEKKRGGEWDKLARKAGFSGSTDELNSQMIYDKVVETGNKELVLKLADYESKRQKLKELITKLQEIS